MNDQELLFEGIKFCNSHRINDSCRKCPLRHNVCITRNGNITFADSASSMSFVTFTEQFRKMVDIISKG